MRIVSLITAVCAAGPQARGDNFTAVEHRRQAIEWLAKLLGDCCKGCWKSSRGDSCLAQGPEHLTDSLLLERSLYRGQPEIPPAGRTDPRLAPLGAVKEVLVIVRTRQVHHVFAAR